ncbi:iron dependent repressor, metal binding and dimerization domain protein [Streptomyces sp. NPDC047017]|uniref:metal-dependent transcriptional regulator n=1 Tax=Streptomyces sp. NPDC047017 TaxID=3155024 RepID=UPI0034054624
MSRLIDTTERYLRILLELEEEGVVPLRARIAERLDQSGPTVSQTVARMERDGLLRVAGDRHLELTDEGRRTAVRVLRKHRLAECLLLDVIGLEWEEVHTEACRWEHVMSEAVERRVLHLLRHPTHSPYGNPIPGLAELGPGSGVGPGPGVGLGGDDTVEPGFDGTTVSLSDMETGPDGVNAVVRRIGEPAQTDSRLMYALRYAGVRPGTVVSVTSSPGGVTVGTGRATVEVPTPTAAHVFVAEH